MLQDLQRDVRVKERVLRQSVQALTDLVSGREHILTQTEQVIVMLTFLTLCLPFLHYYHDLSHMTIQYMPDVCNCYHIGVDGSL